MAKFNISNLKHQVNEKKDDAMELAGKAQGKIAESLGKARENFSVWRNKPIYESDVNDETFQLPNIIQVVDQDDRVGKAGCEGAIGFGEAVKEAPVLTFLTSFAGNLDVKYYPTLHDSVYYVDPMDPTLYIDMDDYFDYLRAERVNELVKVAQDLGATKVSVKLLEEKMSFTGKKRREKAKAEQEQASVSAEGKHDEERREFSRAEILAEYNFPGGEPHMPELNYFRHENEIQFLIDLRMDKNHPATGTQTKRFKASNSFGIKANDAGKIDAALKKIGISANATVTMSELANREDRLFYEYEIVFPE